MFGIRTVLHRYRDADQDRDRRQQACVAAVITCRTRWSGWASLSGQVPKNGRIIVVISAANTLLAVIAAAKTCRTAFIVVMSAVVPHSLIPPHRRAGVGSPPRVDLTYHVAK